MGAQQPRRQGGPEQVTLLASGAGSVAMRRGPARATGWPAILPLVLIPVVLAAFGAVTPPVVAALRGLPTPLRILVAGLALAPVGFAMGTAFPRGLTLAARRSTAGTPWLWAINGAASVLGSILAVLVSISRGVSAALWLGVATYVVAAGAAFRMARAAPAPS